MTIKPEDDAGTATGALRPVLLQGQVILALREVWSRTSTTSPGRRPKICRRQAHRRPAPRCSCELLLTPDQPAAPNPATKQWIRTNAEAGRRCLQERLLLLPRH